MRPSALLASWKGSPTWSAYARFNLGVALVRQKRLADADPFLTAVGTMYAETTELLALKDRANLALGFAYLQAEQPAKAKVALERVRLNGPYSNKALLGTGWADAALGDYKAALDPWMELRGRNLLDAAVQESYAGGSVCLRQAQRQRAVGRISTSRRSSRTTPKRCAWMMRSTGSTAAACSQDVIKSERESRYGWFWQLKEVPDAPESRYLYAVLAGHDFQEGLKNYRDLLFMGHTLDRWGDSMEAFGDMIDTRERAYAQRLPRVDALLARAPWRSCAQRKTDLDNRLNDIDEGRRMWPRSAPPRSATSGRGSSSWRRRWRRRRTTRTRPSSSERLRLVKGVLYFRLNDSFKARMWQQRRTMKDLDLPCTKRRTVGSACSGRGRAFRPTTASSPPGSRR